MPRDAHDLVQATLLGDAAEDAPIGILVAGDDGRYIAANLQACKILGYTRSELLELTVADISPSPLSKEQWADMLASRELTGRAGVVSKDGTAFEIDFMAGPTKTANMLVYVSFFRRAD
jgi:PAS domain S-box-containing protein